jgi:hypothetical protein
VSVKTFSLKTTAADAVPKQPMSTDIAKKNLMVYPMSRLFRDVDTKAGCTFQIRTK